MRRPRYWRLLAAALGFAVVTANPAWGVAHALAHHHDDQQAHQHLRSLESHDRSTELSTSGHADGHRHAQLDQATRTTTHHLVLGPPVTATAADLELAPSERLGDVPGPSVEVLDPPGDDPPRLRAPPLY